MSMFVQELKAIEHSIFNTNIMNGLLQGVMKCGLADKYQIVGGT
jgi:hypothetical protein